MKFKDIINLYKKDRQLFWIGLGKNPITHWIVSNKKYVKNVFQYYMGYPLNLNNPQTYNEKLQWLKLYNKNPAYTKMVDKYEVKKLVSSIIGEEYIIPTLGVWNRFDEIDFNELPDQFVLKCTHDSGGVAICKDKKVFNIEEARIKINNCLKRNYYLMWREWPYKHVPHRIIAEVYKEDPKNKELRDYKFFCFDGEPKLLFVASERQKVDEETKFDFFDMEYNHLSIRNGHPNATVPPEKPLKFEEMKVLARKLSKGIPHVRVDFYEVNGKVFFGELTFAHWSGIVPFQPVEWDKRMGDWINLPIK